MNTDLPVCHSVYLVLSKYTLILTLKQIIKKVIKTGKTFIGAMFSHISFFKTIVIIGKGNILNIGIEC